MNSLSRGGAEAMRKRPVEIVDLTTDDNKHVEVVDLTKVKLREEIPWISRDQRKKRARPLSARERADLRELKKTACWFEHTEMRFSAAMPQ